MNNAINTVPSPVAAQSARRTLIATGTNHALHDGYTDLIYVLLPVWQAEFGLGYAVLASLRALYATAMAGLQIPSGWLARATNGKFVLGIGTVLAAIGYGIAGYSGSAAGLCVALALSGAGSSTQHPLASAAVARAYGAKAKFPLGIYNFTGDLGKAAIPALLSVMLLFISWRDALIAIAALGIAVAIFMMLVLPKPSEAAGAVNATLGPPAGFNRAFHILLAIGIFDSAVRMGFLTFLPFLLQAKGASLAANGFALALVFIGGAAGKFICGWIGEHLGILRTVILTKVSTTIGIFLVLVLPLTPAMILLPMLGLMLNGTSSVIYATVPELAPHKNTEHAFAVFYTGAIGSGAVAPVLYGFLADGFGPGAATIAAAVTAALTCPMAAALSPYLKDMRQ